MSPIAVRAVRCGIAALLQRSGDPMDPHPLDNPVWQSLRGPHRGMAMRAGDVARYPAAVAPFLAVASEGTTATAALEQLIPPGDTAYLLGPVPSIPPGWSLKGPTQLAQMVCPAPLPVIDGPEVVALGEADRGDVLALTALVYPHYFRPRTMDMGRYIGIRIGGRLAAIAGERMGSEAFREVSAICTHPDFLGRGYARRLTALVANDQFVQGRTPFLHVSKDNLRALHLYERMGFRHRGDIAFWSLRRAAEG